MTFDFLDHQEIAAKVLLYHELGREEKAAVDDHLEQCGDCAENFRAVDGLVRELRQIGERKRGTLSHPPEEEMIQFALDDRLLAPEARARVRRHLEEDRCSQCERVYWSVCDLEKESTAHPEIPQSTPKARAAFWPAARWGWRRLALTLAVIVMMTEGLEHYRIVTLKRKLKEREASYNRLLGELGKRERKLASRPNSAFPQKTPKEIQDLDRQVARLSRENQDQGKTLVTLRQKLQATLKPGSNAVSVLLLSAGRGGDALPTAELRPGQLFVVLRATLSKELKEYAKYKLVVEDSRGHAITADRVQKEGQALNDLIRRDLLKPGLYVLKIYGVNHSQEDYLAQFSFRTASRP